MIEQIWEYFKIGLMIGGLFPLIIGLVTVGSWFFPLKPPADTSNRFNRIRLWHWAVTAPHRFAFAFKWMKGDEADNLGRPWREVGSDEH